MRCDTKKFASMYEGIYIDLYRFSLCMMKNEQDAEDAVSDAVLVAYENIHKLRDENAFKSWMFKILSNTCRKKMRDAGHRKKAEIGEPEEDVEHLGEHPDYGLALDVRNAFFILSEEEQEIVALSVFGGYNSKEIAMMLKMNANTVRSKRSRALSKMECVLQ
ncbi:MAG: RNA polymerase sigma factor [Lachnospiraceae bacterium]